MSDLLVMILLSIPPTVMLTEYFMRTNREKSEEKEKESIELRKERRTMSRKEVDEAIEYSKKIAEEARKRKEFEAKVRIELINKQNEIKMMEKNKERKSSDKRIRETQSTYLENLILQKPTLNMVKKRRNKLTTISSKVDNQVESHNLQNHLRDVCYRDNPVNFINFISNKKGYFVSVEENYLYYSLGIIEDEYLRVRCLVDKKTLKLKTIDFREYGHENRYLVRNFFEKVIKDYLPQEIKVREDKKRKMTEEKERKEKELAEIRKEEELLLKEIETKKETIKRLISDISVREKELSVEMKHKFEHHYISTIDGLVEAYKRLSLKSKKEEFQGFMDALEDTLTSLEKDLESVEKDKVYEFKKRVKVLKQRIT